MLPPFPGITKMTYNLRIGVIVGRRRQKCQKHLNIMQSLQVSGNFICKLFIKEKYETKYQTNSFTAASLQVVPLLYHCNLYLKSQKKDTAIARVCAI